MALAERFDNSGADLRAASGLPTGGGADYEGYYLITLDDQFTFAGELEMEVDFDNTVDPIDSRVFNIVEGVSGGEDVNYSGELELGASTIDYDAPEENYSFVVYAVGEISSDELEIFLTTDLLGDFYGADEDYVFGVVQGGADVTLDGETYIPFEITGGYFVAE